MTDQSESANRDYLIDEGMRLAKDDPFTAVSILMTAGFSILTATVGIDNVKKMIPGMFDELVRELPNVN